jgi:hypothetical protein
MITAVDTYVLLDMPGVRHGEESERALAVAVGARALLISEPVYAELASTSRRDGLRPLPHRHQHQAGTVGR